MPAAIQVIRVKTHGYPLCVTPYGDSKDQPSFQHTHCRSASMPYIYREVQSLQDKPLVDGGDCVALVKAYAPGLKALSTSSWRPGKPVAGSAGIQPGTAIATFENGRYPNKPNGNHAAFFVARSGKAIWVMDQWKNDPKHKPMVSMRLIRPGLRNRDGSLRNPSNAAEAFFVIELR